MRKTIFWTVTASLVVLMGVLSFFWIRSYDYTNQLVVRLGTPGVSVWTSDRGRLSLLLLGPQPIGNKWIVHLQANPRPNAHVPTLDELCAENGMGFGVAREVSITGIEKPAVAGIQSASSFAPRRVVTPFWALLALAGGVLLVWCLTRGVRLYRIERGLCGRCSYDVSECSHFCPKCRRPISKRTWSGESRPRRRLASTSTRRSAPRRARQPV